MSTCARCGGYLGEHHACRGRLTAAAAWVSDLLVGGLVGAAIGLLLVGRPLTVVTGEPFEIVGLATGPIAGVALARTLRKLSRPPSRGFHA